LVLSVLLSLTFAKRSVGGTRQQAAGSLAGPKKVKGGWLVVYCIPLRKL